MSQVSLIDGHDDAVKQGDLISRSALHQVCYRCYEKAMRDAKSEITPMQFNEALLAFEKAIKAAPAVDAVEVVRCKDCVWFNTNGYEEGNEDKESGLEFGFCRAWSRETQACVFCSYGERRADDERKTD